MEAIGAEVEVLSYQRSCDERVLTGIFQHKWRDSFFSLQEADDIERDKYKLKACLAIDVN